MRVIPYAQLLRVPNVFTALADMAMGTAAAGTLLERPLTALLLMAASACLYCGGMVWNDYFDLEVDRRERPFRPLPSGRISTRTALGLGLCLLLSGVAFALIAGRHAGDWNLFPVTIAVLLVVAILAYDGWLKSTPVGPINMGLCRLLNVLLATSLADESTFPLAHRLHLALAIGLYIVGVTWFARNEAGRSSVAHLRGAAAVIVAALFVALALPTRQPDGTTWVGFPYALTMFGFFIGLPIASAIATPEPARVQAAVKRCILGLVVFDAVIATVYVGPPGLLILLLLPPALFLGRWVYST